MGSSRTSSTEAPCVSLSFEKSMIGSTEAHWVFPYIPFLGEKIKERESHIIHHCRMTVCEKRSSTFQLASRNFRRRLAPRHCCRRSGEDVRPGGLPATRPCEPGPRAQLKPIYPA